ncbi:MAG TPA: acetyl-CoA carboxylase biotin carboxyl carrier protein subunit [Bacteroidales bacterium]|jgi:biotin carboxyl carrier protein|nr:acetyl-CoA carboxylase biotin carboxyl carrier protein subunit [Bacteroidales bacterium]HPQ63808.1 acetyl-CoA carboxylase biotin carboxyl carrier protein subunit [Bacteroidales bacterium]
MTPEKPVIRKLYALPNEGRRFAFTLPLKNTIRVNGRDYKVELREDDRYGVHVFWKNRRYPVEIVRTRQNRYEILFNDISHTFTIETPVSLQRKKVLGSRSRKNAGLVVRAPMPGKITDVIVREGSEVIRGEALVILEAMKMQNEIQSVVTGTITKIGVKPGQNVMKDDILAEITVK